MNINTSGIDLSMNVLETIEAPVETETVVAAIAGAALGIAVGILIAT
jgi:hypothetical protein